MHFDHFDGGVDAIERGGGLALDPVGCVTLRKSTLGVRHAPQVDERNVGLQSSRRVKDETQAPQKGIDY